jgi:hypothetical protein
LIAVADRRVHPEFAGRSLFRSVICPLLYRNARVEKIYSPRLRLAELPNGDRIATAWL